MALDIRIVTGAGERPVEQYLVMRLAEYWREDGHRVSTGPARELAGDVALLHVDRTRLGPEDVAANPSGIPFLNHRVLDIGKRVVSRNLVRPGDGYSGPVMIKTNANYFGAREPTHSPRPPVVRLLRRVLSWRLARTLPENSYPVLESAAEVPDWVWEEDTLVVERFLPEIVDGRYVLRMWIFFGPEEYGVVLYGSEPVVKAGTKVRWEYLDRVPDFLRAERERLGFDFGKFDYVERDGQAFLLDANKTPTVFTQRSPRLRRLADGLAHFLK